MYTVARVFLMAANRERQSFLIRVIPADGEKELKWQREWEEGP